MAANAFDRCGSYADLPLLDDYFDLFRDAPSISYNQATDTYTDTQGCVSRQIFQEVPSLRFLYPFEWENTFNAWSMASFAARYMHVPFLICGAYLVFCLVGQKVMEGKKPYGLKGALCVWNLLLAVFSAIGFARTAPHLIYFGLKRGLYYSVCSPAEPSFGHGAAGFWTMLFIFSKVPELIDTVFIVLRKNKLIFLHWYHHVTVLLFCWHSYATRSSAGLYFAAMNYGVHALMYFYFFLTACGVKKISWAPIVTALQISQMFVGMFVCGAVAAYRFVGAGAPCDMQPSNLGAGGVMYASYAVLFVVFALEKYITGKSSFEKGSSGGKSPAAVADGAGPVADEGVTPKPAATEEAPPPPASASLRKRK